ncbi:hypothetical protein Calag_1149 [Caldisphaera lagunensis DSM 15908]|uniref:Uncharacterized protein n=1 Tax=Caldisphaera lagunensis (strain DSM 15908 / JCM 11604 / ANMR 0165 / IC-154) TaxID=1056495 RepID=L0AAG5_CALLD|nr:hypothetical protein [Caldisphaera lagunensis]AFZ70871.1 hypothetical protein Calag_1149 [Caldisphaera lagunensis DSM 15908]
MNEHKEPFLFKSYERIIGIAHDVNELKSEMERLSKVDPGAVNYHLKEKHIVNWLNYIGEGELAKKLENVTDVNDALVLLKEEKSAKTEKPLSETQGHEPIKQKRRGGGRRKKSQSNI